MEASGSDLGETRLLDQGLDRLRALLGPTWKIDPINYGRPEQANVPRVQVKDGADAVISISDPSRATSGPILVEVTRQLVPREITDRLMPRVELMRSLTGDAAVLIISPWLSPRSREVLDSFGYGYLDLTGNVSFRLNRPGIVLRMEGEQRSPQPAKSYARNLTGEKAGTLVRALVDVEPPYRATELALATRLSLAYVSRLLDTMEREALITRQSRVVTAVDWRALLRARAANYVLLRSNPPVAMVAAAGIDDVLARLADPGRTDELGQVAVTGPIAAAAVAPLTIGGQLMIHLADSTTERIDRLRRLLGLLPASTAGGDVLVLQTSNPAVFIGRRWLDGVPQVALSQLVLDLLGGSGRMPAEGEAVLEYMGRRDVGWRLPALASWGDEQK